MARGDDTCVTRLMIAPSSQLTIVSLSSAQRYCLYWQGVATIL